MANLLRWLGVVICAVFMLGFGICGAWGVVGGVSELNPEVLLIMGLPGVIGLGFAYLCYRGIRSLLKSRDTVGSERGE